ncbi:MAG: aminotransferase class V-fold PLP-dependent enzyme, partial [Acidimicrobiales bacterium]
MSVSAETYLDNAASAPLRPGALEAMMPYFQVHHGNPSGGHRMARRARQAVEESRDLVAAHLGCGPSEVIFTGGGTESDNLAVRGVMQA